MADTSMNPEPKEEPPVRKFAVQPVETTVRSTRSAKTKQPDIDTSSRRRLVPQLVETTIKSSRRGGIQSSGAHKKDDTPEIRSDNSGQPTRSPGGPSAVRRFAPQLIETTSRSRKRGDTVPAVRQSDKTDLSPGDEGHFLHHHRSLRTNAMPIPPRNTPIQRADRVAHAVESRFSSENLAKGIPRRTSFQVPHLERINSSDDSNPPSLSTTPSAISDEDLQKRMPRSRDTRDEKFSGFILSLAAHAAEKQLKDQALAAYPNEELHHQVAHFAVSRDSSESDGEFSYGLLRSEQYNVDGVQRRESSTSWSMAEMRKHKELVQKQKDDQTEVGMQEEVPPELPPFRTPFDVAALQLRLSTEDQQKNIGGPVHDHEELGMMRVAAAPPMLGRDLKFQMCPSPQQTRIDPTQKPRARNRENQTSRQHSGLWTPGYSTPSKTRKNSAACLWGGFCASAQNDGHNLSQKAQSGLMTPAFPESPARALNYSTTHLLPPQPSASIKVIDDVLSIEANLEIEYPDTFVTQVYNYLALGYPSLAWELDAEISKISKIPIEEIRKNDSAINSKGYLDTPEGVGASEQDAKEHCTRWQALKLYIYEWGRQQSRMAAGEKDNWGKCDRKGSWAG